MYPFRSCFSPDICPGVGVQGYMVALGSSMFSFLRNRHTFLHIVSTNLHTHQQGGRVPFLQPLHHLLFVDFLMIVILTGVK